MTGEPMDLTEKLTPFIDAMRNQRRDLAMSLSAVSRAAGAHRTWASTLENGEGCANPALSKLADWAQAVEAQEFGIYVVIDGHHTSVPIFGDDDED